MTWFSVVSLWLVWNARLVYSIAWLCIKSQHIWPSLVPSLPRLQFLIACSTRQGRPGREISVYHEETSVPAYQKLGWKNLGTRVLYNPNFITSETRTPNNILEMFERHLTYVVHVTGGIHSHFHFAWLA